MYKFICQRQLRFQTHPVSAVSASLLSPLWDLEQCTVQSGCCWRPGFPLRRVAQPVLQAEQIEERARVWQLESHPGFLCGAFQVLFVRVSVPKPLKGPLNTAFSILISISGFFFRGEMSFSHQRAEIQTNERIPGFLLRWEFFRLLGEQSRIPTYGSQRAISSPHLAFWTSEGEGLTVLWNLVLAVSEFSVLAEPSSLSSHCDCRCWASELLVLAKTGTQINFKSFLVLWFFLKEVLVVN